MLSVPTAQTSVTPLPRRYDNLALSPRYTSFTSGLWSIYLLIHGVSFLQDDDITAAVVAGHTGISTCRVAKVTHTAFCGPLEAIFRRFEIFATGRALCDASGIVTVWWATHNWKTRKIGRQNQRNIIGHIKLMMKNKMTAYRTTCWMGSNHMWCYIDMRQSWMLLRVI